MQPHGLEPARLLRPWDSPGKNPGVGRHFLLQGIFRTQGSSPGILCCRQILYHLSHQICSVCVCMCACVYMSLVAQTVKNACNVGDLNSIPGLGRSPRGVHGNPLLYSCLENPHGQRSLAGYSPWGHRVGHYRATKHSRNISLKRQKQTTTTTTKMSPGDQGNSDFPGSSTGRGEPSSHDSSRDTLSRAEPGVG